jgi:CheY-like chemotaxis protein
MISKKTVLLVDDEVDFVDLVKFQLLAKGYHVVTAHNGFEALEAIGANTPDLIVMDINMPKMGGLDFYNKISTEFGRSKYPILVLTARTNLEKTFRDLEVDGFMTKPFEIDDLIREVERLSSGGVNQVIFLIDSKENPNVKQMTGALLGERYEVVNVEDLGALRDRAAGKKPAFIILEYMQKEMAGDKFITAIKSDPLFRDIPIIVYSYSGFKEYEDKSLKAGADKYLGKPESSRDVLRALKELRIESDKKSGKGVRHYV